MRLRIRIFPILFIYLFLISAIPIVRRDSSKINKHSITLTYHNNSNLQKFHKLNFFQRLIVKFYLKRNKLQNVTRADKLASASLWLGLGACGLVLFGFLFRYLSFLALPVLLALPVGIVAIITGNTALRNKTSSVRKARMGKAFGLVAIIVFAALVLVIALILATSGGVSFD